MLLGGRSGCAVMRDEVGQPGEGAAARRAAGELEAGVLAVLQAADRPLPPGEVRELVGGGLAYTTVVTILSRLYAKGVLQRRMARVLDGEADREAVLARFVSGLSGSDEELLRRMLGDSPGPGRG